MNPWKERVEIGPHVLYLGDAREILPTVAADAVVTDPPYGLGDLWQGGDAQSRSHWHHADGGAATKWDAKPCDFIDQVVAAAPKAIIWGGNYFVLPPSRAWLSWDKTPRDFTSGAFELAWTNLDQPTRSFTAPRCVQSKEHPTEKPLALMLWCLGFLPDAQTILDPMCGSGTTGVACAKLGRRFIGVEIHEPYFRIACRRIADAVNGGVQPELFA